ncbi:MAG TPA: hypothetical protein PKE52_03365 [Bacteroidales bacterium]|jgi:hypothetical protein|nr:hypothetical protein [Bacteroidales bacterium]
MKEIRVLGLLITDRIKEAGRTQQLLSDYADIVSMRLGFHEVTSATCSRVGIMLIQLDGATERQIELEDKLRALEGIDVQQMKFEL